jgi:sec-independent protein translocase protein TatA
MDTPGWAELLIIGVVVILLFGSKKLPDAARSIGRSLRIFKTEVKGLHDDEKPAELPAASAAPSAGPAPVVTTPAAAPPPAAGESNDGR